MIFLGRTILGFVRAFHFWHKHHLQVSFGLLIAAAVGFAITYFGLASATLSEFSHNAERWLGITTGILFGLHSVLIPLGRIAARFWPPSVVPFISSMPVPDAKPINGHWIFQDKVSLRRFRFRYATENDLNDFNSLAMSDPAIVFTYSYLDARDWSELYRHWQGFQKENLMVLEEENLGSRWSVVAVSIVVPLSQSAASLLWTGAIGTVDINETHMCKIGKRPAVLLVDFVAAKRRVLGKLPEMVFALPKIHLSRHWDFLPRRKMEIWIEPVHRSLPKMLSQIGFNGPHKTGKNHTLYTLALPIDHNHLSDKQKNTVDRLIETLHEASAWHIE